MDDVHVADLGEYMVHIVMLSVDARCHGTCDHVVELFDTVLDVR